MRVEVGVLFDVIPFDGVISATVSSSSVVLLLLEFQEAVSGDLLTPGTKDRVNSVTEGLIRLVDLLSSC